jgi:hypothetical protein
MNRMSKTLAQFSSAAIHENTIVWILHVRKQVGEDKYDHCKSANFSKLFRRSLWTAKVRPLRLHFRIRLSMGVTSLLHSKPHFQVNECNRLLSTVKTYWIIPSDRERFPSRLEGESPVLPVSGHHTLPTVPGLIVHPG